MKGDALSGTALAAGAAFGLTMLLMPPVLMALRRLEALDHPNERSSHGVPTLRGGGLGPLLACLVAVSVAPGVTTPVRTALLLVTGGFGLLGAFEDLRGLSAGRRFLAQLVVALVASYAIHPLLGSTTWGLVGLPVVVVWLVSYVNAFNFMDGINGISAAQVIAGGVGLAVMGLQAGDAQLASAGGLVAGAALGFAPFNFPKARVFLGDTGSYFFGGWLAMLAVVALLSGVPPEATAAPFLVYLADTGTTLARRVLLGEAWHQPHRSHVYQRLTGLGWSHTLTTVWVLAVITGCTALGVVAIEAPVGGRLGAVIGMVGLVVVYLASPALAARLRSRRMAEL